MNKIKMAGVVLETLSTKKLIVLSVSLLLLLTVFFLIGGLIGNAYTIFGLRDLEDRSL